MPWYLTTARQVKGFRRELTRLDEALSRQDVRGIGSPLSRMRAALGLGAIAGVGVLALALVISLIAPKPDGKLSSIVTTRSGGMFVMFNGRLHPVTNLASARLIVGKPDPAVVVGERTLRDIPTGPLMGIPNAPDLLDPRTDPTASWTVCTWRDTAVPLSLLRAGDLTVAVIAGSDALSGGEELGSTRAVLVRPADNPAELWLVYRDTRAQVGVADFAAQAALGITPAAAQAAQLVPPALLYAIPVSPVLTAPPLADRGQPSAAVAGSKIGDILTTGTAGGTRVFHLVGGDGVQQIGPVLAQLMINTGSEQKLVADPAAVQKLPRTSLVDDGRFPASVPTLISPASLCWNWTKTAGDLTARTRVLTGPQLPITEAAKAAAVKLLPNGGTAAQATESVMRPGYGWFARVTGTGADSPGEETPLWVDPNGTRYPIDAVLNPNGGQNTVSYDPTVHALGLDTVRPTPIPWAVARLYAPGATLSIRNAQVMQGTITPVSQVPSPSPSVKPDAPSGTVSMTPLPPPPPPPPPPPATVTVTSTAPPAPPAPPAPASPPPAPPEPAPEPSDG